MQGCAFFILFYLHLYRIPRDVFTGPSFSNIFILQFDLMPCPEYTAMVRMILRHIVCQAFFIQTVKRVNISGSFIFPINCFWTYLIKQNFFSLLLYFYTFF